MGRLRASFLYELNGLWVDRVSLGQHVCFERDHLSVDIRIPLAQGEFADRVSAGDPHWPWLPFTGTTISETENGGDDFFEIRVIEVAVRGESPISSSDFPPAEGPSHDAATEGFGFLRRAQTAADAAISDFLDWMRVWGQPWLGLNHQVPLLFGEARLCDDENGMRLSLGWPPFGQPRKLVSSLVAADLMALEHHLALGVRPSLPASVLADARFLADEQRIDAARAVLTAAIAVEIEATAVLRAAAQPGIRTLLDVVLENPRDWSLRAAGLLDQPMAAVAGRSLRREKKELFKGVERLFRVRNQVAHRGHVPSENEARELVEVARQTFMWLAEIAVTPSPPERSQDGDTAPSS